MFVQIERGVSLLVLKYSRTYPQSPIPAPWCVCMCVCETQNAGTDPRIPALRGGNFNQTSYNRPLGDIAGCKALKSDVRRGPMMQKPLSGTLDHQEFLRVKNRNDGNPGENTPGSPPGQHTRSPRVRAGGGRARLVREGNARGECDELVALQSSTNQSIPSQRRISDTPGTEDVREAGISLLQNLFHPLVQI